MNISNLIKEVHRLNKNLTPEDLVLEDEMEFVYSKLLKSIAAYNENNFSDLSFLDDTSGHELDKFRSIYIEKVKDSFEGELSELLFAGLSLMGLLMEEDFYPHLEFEADVNKMLDSDLLSPIVDELIFFSVRLDDLKCVTNKLEFLEELIRSINRILYICRYENIEIKTYIRLNFLYKFT